MPFQKGNTYGKAGRPPKGEAAAELLRAQGELTYRGTKLTYRERAAQVVWEQACAGRQGSLDAFKWIVDRIDGKVPETINQNLRGEVDHAISDEMIEAVLRAYAQRE